MTGGRDSRLAALVAGLLLALAGVAAGVHPATGSSRAEDAQVAPQTVAIPLTGSVSTAGASWAVVLMGKNDGDFDLFWQLFMLDPRTSRWSLATPPGVADNGGLMIAPRAATTLLVGFATSQGLDYSPLALTRDGAAKWTPGGLENALAVVPSALALGADGGAVALVKGSQQAVLSQSGILTNWKTLVTTDRLASLPDGAMCGVGALTAVDVDPIGNVLAGATCRRDGSPGVFVDTGSTWRLADLPVPGTLAHDSFEVLRLSPGSGSPEALLAASDGTTALVAAWDDHKGGPWTLSSPLGISSQDHLIATGTGPGTSQFVLLRDGTSRRLETIAGPGSPWKKQSDLPKGTATIAFEPGGRIDALCISDTKLSIYRLNTTGAGWSKVQSIDVPIIFGSSG